MSVLLVSTHSIDAYMRKRGVLTTPYDIPRWTVFKKDDFQHETGGLMMCIHIYHLGFEKSSIYVSRSANGFQMRTINRPIMLDSRYNTFRAEGRDYTELYIFRVDILYFGAVRWFPAENLRDAQARSISKSLTPSIEPLRATSIDNNTNRGLYDCMNRLDERKLP